MSCEYGIFKNGGLFYILYETDIHFISGSFYQFALRLLEGWCKEVFSAVVSCRSCPGAPYHWPTHCERYRLANGNLPPIDRSLLWRTVPGRVAQTNNSQTIVEARDCTTHLTSLGLSLSYSKREGDTRYPTYRCCEGRQKKMEENL